MLELAFLGLTVFARDLGALYPRAKVGVGGVTLDAFVADDDRRRADGLMYVERLAPDRGMLFVFAHPQRLNFWMKNTLIPLSIGFFDERCRLVDTQEMRVATSIFARPPSYQSRADAVFALEANAGWFKRHGIKTGAALALEGPSTSAPLRAALARCPSVVRRR